MLYDHNNIFAKILREEIPCIKVYEDEYTLVFMDIMPQADGHTLVIPKLSVETLFELPDEYSEACLRTIKKVGNALKKAFNVQGIVLFQLNHEEAGQTVPHLHFHLLPSSLASLTSRQHGVEMADSELLLEQAEKIRSALE